MIAGQNFKIEIECVDASLHYFIISSSLLDGPETLAPDVTPNYSMETFILDQSLLDSTVDLLEGIGYAKDGYRWLDITSTSTFVDIRRGNDQGFSVVARPYSGNMVVKVIDPYLDALANKYVAIGNRMRLRVDQDIVFMGGLKTFRTEYDARGVPVLQATAFDAISLLNSTPMDARPAETYAQRVAAACNAAGVMYTVSGTGQNLVATSDGKTALETLFSAQDSEGSFIWVDVDNTIHALQRGEEVAAGTADYLFSNDHTVTGHICMSAFANTLDTEQVINQVDFNNLEWTGSGSAMTTKSVNYSFSDTGSTRYYGVKKQSLSTTLDPVGLSTYADHIFAEYAEANSKVKSLSFPVDHFRDSTVNPWTYIDIGDVVDVVLNDPMNTSLSQISTKQRVSEISHQISPTYWDCQIGLL